MQVVRDPSHPETPGTIKKARTIVRQSIGNGQWVKLDATVLVSEWFKSSKENWGFIINSTTVDGQKIVVTDNIYDEGSKVKKFTIVLF